MSDVIEPRQLAWNKLKREQDNEAQVIDAPPSLQPVPLPPTVIEVATEYHKANLSLKEAEQFYSKSLQRFSEAEQSFDAMWRAKEHDAQEHDTFLLAQAHEVELARVDRLARRRSLASEPT